MTPTAIPHLRTSERHDFKRCPQRWQWAWRQGLKRRTVRPDALWFGTGIHLALQERYKYPGLKRGRNVLKVWRDFVGDEMSAVKVYRPGWTIADESEWVNAKLLGEIMLGAYLDIYGKDERWWMISAEQTFEIPIPNLDGKGTLVIYNGTFDKVARDLESSSNALWLWDHKTAKVIQTGHLTLDDQAGSYWAVAGDVLSAQGLVQPGEQLEGILYDFLRKAKTDQRPTNDEGRSLNKDGSVSKVQPAPNFLRYPVYRDANERKTQIERIQAEATIMQLMRKGQIPIFKNPTKDCCWDCPFFEMCELHEQKQDWKQYRSMVFARQDPYAAHREAKDDE